MPVNHQGNPCKIKKRKEIGDICGGSNQMIILRCAGERAETTFWQFHHALLHSSSSQNWHCWLWSKPKQGCDIPKEVFQMISVTESIVSKHWQCFKGCNVEVRLCRCMHRPTEPRRVLADSGSLTSTLVIPTPYNRIILFTMHGTYFLDVVIVFFFLLNLPHHVTRLKLNDLQCWCVYFIMPVV